MANGLAITAANAVYILAIPNLFPNGVQLQGFSADAAFDTDASEPAEVVKGVDGFQSYGYVPYMTKQTISIMPDSLSSLIFETWLAAQKAAREIYPANATIALLGVKRAYTLTSGILTNIIPIPGTRKVLQARQFQITWNEIDPAPFTL